MRRTNHLLAALSINPRVSIAVSQSPKDGYASYSVDKMLTVPFTLKLAVVTHCG